MRTHHPASVYYLYYAVFCLVAATAGVSFVAYREGIFHKIDALEGRIAGWERDTAARVEIGISKDELNKELGR